MEQNRTSTKSTSSGAPGLLSHALVEALLDEVHLLRFNLRLAWWNTSARSLPLQKYSPSPIKTLPLAQRKCTDYQGLVLVMLHGTALVKQPLSASEALQCEMHFSCLGLADVFQGTVGRVPALACTLCHGDRLSPFMGSWLP